MAVNPVSLKNLNKFKALSEKVIQAPLGKKKIQLVVEQPIEDILYSLPAKDRLTLVRRAIAKELAAEGLLTLPSAGGEG